MTTATTNSSRSSSPDTPESLSDDIFNDHQVDLSAWCHSFSPHSDSASWHPPHQLCTDNKIEDNVFTLDGILRENVYNSMPSQLPTSINPAVFQLMQPFYDLSPTAEGSMQSPSEHSSSDAVPVPDLLPWSQPTGVPVSKAVPPPPARPRRIESSASSNRVVHPPKESCYNLAIVTPSIPPTGTKSRVETQVRVQVDLAHTSSSGDSFKYDRVGSWKWLKLPKGTATRKRSRKEGKIDASPADTLYLKAEVTCSSSPHTRVVSCSTCRGREAKRIARKIAARVRPARSDSDTNDGPSGRESDDKANVIQFNCPDTLDFSNGTAILPLRITCYCRHHREKVGFNVRFTAEDETGRIVGQGISPPIMITDDHKTTAINAAKQSHASYVGTDGEWDPKPVAVGDLGFNALPTGAPSKRRQSQVKDFSPQVKRRGKPYDNMRSTMNSRSTRSEYFNDLAYPDQDSTQGNPYPDIALAVQYSSTPPSVYSSTAPPSPRVPDGEASISLPSPPISYASPTDSHTGFFENDIVMSEQGMQPRHFAPLSPPHTAPSSPPSNSALPLSSDPSSADLMSMPFNILAPQPDPAFTSVPLPRIHRVIPSSGPTYGGIEITILGSNFHPAIQFNCVFGDVVASSTSRWSDNTLLCVLPPRAYPGTVPVSLEGIKTEEAPRAAPVLFTYTDESDRALMELALQVVGLKMTGKLEDAKNVAMRIVGTSSQDHQTDLGGNGMIDVNSSSTLVDPRRLLLSRVSDGDFEKHIIDFLSVLDAPVETKGTISLASSISHQTSSGQTLLHLATFLNFPSLVEFLVEHEIDLDAKDQNGFTALHFAALVNSRSCARVLLDAGANADAVDVLSRTPADVSPVDLFQHVRGPVTHYQSDDEARWGDAEEDSGDERLILSRPQSRALYRRRVRRPASRRTSKPSSVTSDGDGDDQLTFEQQIDDDDTATVVAPDSLNHADPTKDGIDEKQAAASLAEFFQRAWAQFQPPQIMAQMPQIPQLRGVPGWVFPVFVPMPAWPALPAFRSEKRGDGSEGGKERGEQEVEARSPNSEWRVSWEKWMAQMTVMVDNKPEVDPSSGCKPSHELDNTSMQPSQPSTQPESPATPVPEPSRSLLRRFGYGPVQITDTDVDSFTYRPKRSQKVAQKEDRMLVLFWIPILILAIGWALYYTLIPLAFSLFKGVLPLSETNSILSVNY